MLFSAIISSIDSLKSLLGSTDAFTTALLRRELTVADELLAIFLVEILGERSLSFTPAGELTAVLRTVVVGLVMMGWRWSSGGGVKVAEALEVTQLQGLCEELSNDSSGMSS